MKRKFILVILALVILTILVASRPVDDERVAKPNNSVWESYPPPYEITSEPPIAYPAPVWYTPTVTATRDLTASPTATPTNTLFILPTPAP